MQSGYTPLDHLRYERKFVTENTQLGRLWVLLRAHPALFRQVFEPRQVNNIYFDTPGLDCFHDNLIGVSRRWKARIRWYGTDKHRIGVPVLELKIKNGFLGTKRAWKLPAIELGGGIDFSTQWRELIHRAEIPEDVRSRILGMSPVLFNYYQRSYYESFDRRFRITLDSGLSYSRPGTNGICGHAPMFREEGKLVLELKYDQIHEADASKVSQYIPFRLNKNSKYVTGMSFLWPGVAH